MRMAPKDSASPLDRLRSCCPPWLKAVLRPAWFWTKRRLVHVIAADERAEIRDLEAGGMLKLEAADAALLRRPLAARELYEVDESRLGSSRFFFYQLDSPLRGVDIVAYGLDSVPYWDRILTNMERPFELHWLIKLLRARGASGGACLEVGCGRRFPVPYLLATHYGQVAVLIWTRALWRTRLGKTWNSR